MNIHELFEDKAKKQRLDPKCWTGYHKAGTKVKGGVRVNNCVPNEGIEVVSEFAPPGGDDSDHDPEELLFRLAKQWWLGTESDMIRVERTLASMGWEIGEDEGYDDGGVFVVQAGDENGKSYISWPHEDLADEGVAEEAGTKGYRVTWSEAGSDKHTSGLLLKHHAIEHAKMLKNKPGTSNVKVIPYRSVEEGHRDEDNPFSKGSMGDALYKALGSKKVSPQQVQRNRERFAKRDAERYTIANDPDKPGLYHYSDIAHALQNGHSDSAKVYKHNKFIGTVGDVRQQDLAEGELDEKSTSQAQFRTMAAAAHNPAFAKKVGIKPSVAKEFHGADRKQSYRSLPKKVDEGIMDFMQPQQPKTTKDKLTLAAMRQIEKARADKERQDPTYVRSKDLPKNPDHVRVVTDAKGDYKPPKEADYGADYQDMVRRVAAQEKRKQQQPKPAKREDSNMPVAVDSTSPIHGANEDSEGVSTKNISPASQKLIQKARQAAPDARSDLDAVFAYLDDVAKRTQDNYGRVNDILQQLDPMSNDLDKAERELDRVRQVNQGQQQLLGRLKSRLDKTGADTAPVQAQQAQQDKRDADERDAIGQQLAQEPQQVVVKQEPQGPVDAVDKVARQKADQAERDIHNLYSKDASSTASKTISQIQQRMLTPPSDPKIDPSTTVVNPDKIKALAKNFLQKDEITEDIYESRLYKMKLAGYFD